LSILIILTIFDLSPPPPNKIITGDISSVSAKSIEVSSGGCELECDLLMQLAVTSELQMQFGDSSAVCSTPSIVRVLFSSSAAAS
jgi:hypothetical protein